MDTKVCRKCGVEKPTSEYYFSNREKGYLCYICKPCSNAATKAFYHSHPETRAKCAARAKAWNIANPDKTKLAARRSSLKGKFGLSEADYEAMRTAQNNRCAVCQSEDTGRKSGKWANGHWHIDHCHETGRIRGLLCHGCNVRLGGLERLLRDRPLEWIMAYIAK